ncbi:MAG: helix-turn-helix domain-containing protein [Prolixibacteraceae bacterium]|nr:helix-turn-helix domain-containing protein [Prolixibacteraceae bacterium]
MTATKTLETPIFQLTVGEFLTILKQEHKSPVSITPQVPEIFGAKTFKEITGYSFASIYAKTSKNELPHFKRDGKLFFRRDEVMDWLTANPVATIQESCNLLDEKLTKKGRRAGI